MSLPVFADFDKTTQDIFSENYKFKKTLKMKSSCKHGLNTTVEVEHKCDSTSQSMNGSVSFKFKKDRFSLDKLKMAANGTISAETSLTGLAPGLTLSFEGDSKENGTLGVEYNHDMVTLDASVDAVNFQTASVSALFGVQDVQVGGEVECNLPKGETSFGLSNYAFGLCYSRPNFFVGLRSANLKDHSLAGHYNVNNDTTVGLLGECSGNGSDYSVTLGTSHKYDCDCTIFGKVNSDAILSLAVNRHLCCKNIQGNLSGEVNLKDPSQRKWGLGLTFA
jgi:hypothetical protein